MKVRNLSRLEKRYAGLMGLHTILRTTLIGYMISFILILIMFSIVFSVADPAAGNPAFFEGMTIFFIVIAVFLISLVIVERLIVGAMNLKRIPILILIIIWVGSIIAYTFNGTLAIYAALDISILATFNIFVVLAIYINLSIFICQELAQCFSMTSYFEKELFLSKQESLATWDGIVHIFGLPKSFSFVRHKYKRILILMMASSVCLSILPASVLFLSPFAFTEMQQEVLMASTYESHQYIDDLSSDRITYFFLMFVPALAIILFFGAFLRRRGLRFLTDALYEMSRYDRRRPVLFLRAFEDDQIVLRQTQHSTISRILHLGRPQESIDTLLLEEGSRIGPVVALGDPEKLGARPYGAIREYRGDESWVDAIEAYMRNAKAIVFVLENADGVWRELEMLFERKLGSKTLFILHPRYTTAMERGLILEKLLQFAKAARVSDFDGLGHPDLKRRKRRLIGFHLSSRGELTIYESREFSWISAMLLLRIFFGSSRFTREAPG